jgi:hypothetical protein
MNVYVRHEVLPIVYEPGTYGSKSAETWWAECSDCGKRSKGFLVGEFSAPAMEAELEAGAHLCDLERHFSTRGKAWDEFWRGLASA